MSISAKADPFEQFATWFAEARQSAIPEPTAMALATVNEHGHPEVRMVLLKGHGPDGFVFYTNLGSAKARALSSHPFASLCMYWNPPGRQVRVSGPVAPVSDAEADEYFASRDRLSRIGAYASRQSQPLESRFALEQRVAKYTLKFGVGEVPRPDFWSGFRIIPERIELWEQRSSRLHERVEFKRAPDGSWPGTQLYP